LGTDNRMADVAIPLADVGEIFQAHAQRKKVRRCAQLASTFCRNKIEFLPL
jgi:hypothetical protein